MNGHQWQVKPDQGYCMWQPSAPTSLRFSIQGSKLSQVEEIRICFAKPTNAQLLDHKVTITRDKNNQLVGEIRIHALPGSDISIPIKAMRINDNLCLPTPPPLVVTVRSPFHHWHLYETREGIDPLEPISLFFPRRNKQAIRPIVCEDTKILWLHGAPGCGKTFLLSHYIEAYLRKKTGDPVIFLQFPLGRWQVLSQIATASETRMSGKKIKELDCRFRPVSTSSSNLLQFSKFSISLPPPDPRLFMLVDNAYNDQEFPDIVFELIHLISDLPRYLKPGLRLVVTDIFSFEGRLNCLRTNDPLAAEWLDKEISFSNGQIQDIEMNRWSEGEMKQLVKRHTGKELGKSVLGQLYKATAGHPYLLAACLDNLTTLYNNEPLDSLEIPPLQEYGQFLIKQYCQMGFLTEEEKSIFKTIRSQIESRWNNLSTYSGDVQKVLPNLIQKGIILTRKNNGVNEYRFTGAFTGGTGWH